MLCFILVCCVLLCQCVCLFCVLRVCELLGETIRSAVAILLLNGMEVFSVCSGAMLDRPCMVFQRVCVLCL